MPEPTFIGGYPTFWATIFSEIARYINNPTLTRFYSSNDTSAAAARVASLLRGIGAAVNMDYGKDSSSARNNKVKTFLEDMGYKNVERYSSDLCGKMEMMIRKGYPAPVHALRNWVRGHAWVVDGFMIRRRLVETYIPVNIVIGSHYESHTLYHCNFGWTGQCDGYYYGNAVFNSSTNPVEKDQGDSPISGTGDNYHTDERIICYDL